MKSIVVRLFLGLAVAFIPKMSVEAQEKQPDPVEASPVGEITETAGTRFIGGVYPHLTTYSQSRLDGLFNQAGSSECGIGAIAQGISGVW